MNKMTTIACLVTSVLLSGCHTVPSNQPKQDYMALYEQANRQGQDEQAFQYLKLAVAQDDPEALVRIGESYWHGRYGLNDPEKGFDYIQRAALKGVSKAMTDMGIFYLDGSVVTQDYQKAYQWFSTAEQSGDRKAPRYLGLIYQNGWGKPVDAAKAAQCYEQGADHGDITSQYYLGKLYENGLGVKRDYAKALSWYEKSAARGDVISLPAILALGHVYEQGLGVKKDIKTALVWFNKAAALGDSGAKTKVGQYQYPSHPQIMNISALVKVIGDGQKVAGIAIEYTQNVNPVSLNLSDYKVPGREVSNVYLSKTPVLGEPSQTGSIVIVALKTEVDPTSSHMGGGPKKDEGKPGHQGPMGTNGPKLGEISDKPATPVILHASVIQTGEVALANGVKVKGSKDTLATNATLNPDIQGFQQLVFHDAIHNRDLMYNLYVPKHYDPSKSYPLVLFMHDAGVVSNNPTETLTQGLGAVIWASDRDQVKHESFVLAPQYNAVMTDDNSNVSVDMDITVDLIKQLMTHYSIDANRLYNTGQSMGGMTSIAMDIKYPDLFAASLLVACQWDPKLVAPMAQKPLWIIVSQGDTKAKPGMDAITKVLTQHGATVANATWDAQASAQVLSQDVSEMLSQGKSINYTVFKGGDHRYTWQYAYSIDGIRDWLFRQKK